jgi:hypothetical protein
MNGCIQIQARNINLTVRKRTTVWVKLKCKNRSLSL